MEYTYYAFISYKHEDEKWAKWLQKKLEAYGFPTALRKENPTLPSKIRPVFRDQSELSGGNLKDEIEKGLKGSKYLIVVCSPRAAKSPWVSKEVQYFIDHGRENNIIPFIIGGSPNASNPEDECFPEGLRQLSGEKEILGININEMGRDAATIKVIARMFDLRFDTLWQRHERAKHRRRIAIILGTLLFAILGFSVGAYMVYLNTQVVAERDRAEKQTQIAKKERNRANDERDNALKANKALAQAKDSLQIAFQSLSKASDSIKYQSNIIKKTNVKLEDSNTQISKQMSQLISGKAYSLSDEDSYKATELALDALSYNQNSPEAERALRNALNSNNLQIKAAEYNVNAISFSPDSKHIATSDEDESCIRIWDLYDGSLLNTYNCDNEITAISYNPDNSYLLAGTCSGDLLVINDDSIHTIQGSFSSGINSVDFNNDGSLFATLNSESNFTLWDAYNFHQIESYELHESPNKLKFSHSGNQILIQCEHSIYLYNLTTHSFISYLDKNIHCDDISYNLSGDKIYFSGRGQIEDYDNIGFLRILDSQTLDVINTIQLEPFECIQFCVLNGKESFITTSSDGYIKLWEASNNIPFAYLQTQEKRHEKLIISASNRYCALVSGNHDGYISIIDLNKWGNEHVESIWNYHINNSLYLSRFEFASNNTGNYFLFGVDGQINIYRSMKSMNPEELYSIQTKEKFPNYYVSPTGKYLFVCEGQELKMIELLNGDIIKSMRLPHKISNIQFIDSTSDKDLCVFANHEDSLFIYEINMFEDVAKFKMHSYDGDKGRLLGWSLLNSNILYGSIKGGNANMGYIAYYDMISNKIEIDDIEYKMQRGLSISPDKKYIAFGGYVGNIQIYDIFRRKVVNTIKAHTSFFDDINWHPSGKYLISSDGNSIKIWSFPSGICIKEYSLPQFSIFAKASFSKDGRYIICKYGNNVQIFEFLPFEELIDKAKERLKIRN